MCFCDEVFKQYTGGIIDQDCNGDLEHSVLLVGFGTDEATGTDYWIIRNSMGADWGENGYFRMVRNPNGPHINGILESVTVPILNKS